MNDQTLHLIELLQRIDNLALLIGTGVAAVIARTRWGQTRDVSPQPFPIAPSHGDGRRPGCYAAAFTSSRNHRRYTRVLSAFLLFGALVRLSCTGAESCSAAGGRDRPLQRRQRADFPCCAVPDAWSGHLDRNLMRPVRAGAGHRRQRFRLSIGPSRPRTRC